MSPKLSDLLLHLAEQVDHHHTTLGISVSHSHPTTRTGNHQLIRHVAIWVKSKNVSWRDSTEILWKNKWKPTDLHPRCSSPWPSRQQPSGAVASAGLRSEEQEEFQKFHKFHSPFKMYQISVCIAALWRLQGGEIFTSVHLIRFLLTVTQQRAELIYSRVTSDEYLFQVFIVQVQRGDYSPGRSQRQQQLHTCPCASRPWRHQPWCLLHRCRRWYPGNATSEAHLLTKYKLIPATSFWFPTWHLPACYSSC